ncbi:MAG: membrane protein insertase YidC [Deltaproteobacteria bacterium]|nr:membrane protein insertase YidC [Deltaproteobacteria bacterium]
MDKRTLIAVVVVIGALFLWQILSSKKGPQPLPPAPVTAPATAPAPASATATATATAPAPVAAPVAPKLHMVETPDAKYVFTDHGAVLHQVTLHGFTDNKKQPLELVDELSRAAHPPLKLDLFAKSFAYPDNPVYAHVPGASQTEFSYKWSDGATVEIEKKYRVREKYLVDLEITFTRLGAAKVWAEYGLIMTGADAPGTAKSASMFGEMPDFKSPLCRVDNSLNRETAADVAKQPKRFDGAVSFVGIDRRFFASFLMPHEPERHSCIMTAHGAVIIAEVTSLNRLSLEDKQKTATVKYSAYFGPKQLKVIDGLAIDANGIVKPHLDDSVDFWILGFICRPMLWLLNGFHSIFGNWGIAIILLTFLVKLLTFHWTQKSYKSMQAMSALKPKLDEVKAKCGDNKERYNQEVMNLYKAHKINPLSGCLPMLMQMPIWIALYRMLNSAVELYHAPFLFWLQDLSAADPYFILPILNGVTVFLQQLLTPSTIDNRQMKFMLYFMPILFSLFMLFLPSGLVLYIFVSTLLSIAQQWYIKKNAKKAAGGKVAGKSAPVGKMAKQAEAK